MAQKKSETALAADEKKIPAAEETVIVGSFVTTFWDQYEQSRERREQLRENREDAYINALREVIKFNKQYRKSIAKLYDQTKKTNKDAMSELMHQFKAVEEEVKEEPAYTNDREELKNQLKEVSGQLEKLALTPIRSIFQIIDQLEDNFEKNAESRVAYARERRNAWLAVRKEYVRKARNTHLNLVERGKSSFKELVKTQ
ncbi:MULTISPECIES: hypothetical protein [Bacillaceae]|uniref:hypothetical protein n=1 Tax=Bacillaceae TaxID=186817 RepID=UPI00118BF15C|nr:hypothetical protein [Bacillus sp. S3]QCJ41839.1 hypothetical protein FAY30_08025 [Bacillus sp. S3]